MKTLEKLRKEAEDAEIGHDESRDYAYIHGFVRQIFRGGWDAAIKELTGWRDPKEEVPETDDEVLVVIDADSYKYDVMQYDRHGWWQKAPDGGWCAATNAPARWRYIHTSMSYEAKARTE